MPKVTKRFYCSPELLIFINNNGNGKAIEDLIITIKTIFDNDGYALENARILIESSKIDSALLQVLGKFKKKD